MPAVAILPIKNLKDAKSRLSSQLPAGPRRALTEAMFADVLTALRRASEVEQVLAVTSDNSAQRIAGGHGAVILEDTGSSHSDAAMIGIEYALERGISRVLLVPGDCPLLSPAELNELIAREHGERSALIVPDRHGTGTNALLLTPPGALTPAFGEGSRNRHLQLAQSQGTAAELVEVPGLALDVDTPDDLAALAATLAATRGGAAHTRGMLNQLARSQA
jgi:2-phospho-L-lactate guanylyltransferase